MLHTQHKIQNTLTLGRLTLVKLSYFADMSVFSEILISGQSLRPCQQFSVRRCKRWGVRIIHKAY